MYSRPFNVCSLGLLVLLLSSGCTQDKAAAPPPPPPKVEFSIVEKRDVPIVREFVATLDGFVNAEIKAQVSGYLIRRNYQEGVFVRKGTTLFEIDPRPFEAVLNQAKAQQQQASGNVRRAEGDLEVALAQQSKRQLDVKRYTPLAKTAAISQQELDDAIQANRAAGATVAASQAAIEAAKSAVAAAEANVHTAELQLSFTRVVAPIDGIVGIAQAQVGDLVSPAGQSLTTMSTLNPIKAYFTVAEQQYLAYNRDLARGERQSADKMVFDLVLSDGSMYSRKGKFFAVDRQVDVGTGALRLAAIFPNPDNLLRPGEFARVRAVVNTERGALMVPQRAVTEIQGTYQVAVIGQDNKVSIRPVKLGERQGPKWIVREGLSPGERVIAEGTQKARDGQVVEPTPHKAREIE